MNVFEGSRRQQGGYFQGSRRQRGGNLFSTIKRMIIPMAQSLKPKVAAVGKDLVKRGLKVGVGALRDKALDALSKNPTHTSLVDNLKKRTSKEIGNTVTDYFGEVEAADPLMTSQDGEGLKRKACSKGINKMVKRRKTVQFNDVFT